MKHVFTKAFCYGFSLSICAYAYLSTDTMKPICIPSKTTINYALESDVIPYADVIVYKSRIHNGVKQYRRWNQTKSCLVDPDWIDLL